MQIYVEVEENANCDYSPLQTFQTLEPPKKAGGLRVPEVSGKAGPHEVIGWCSDGDGSGDGGPCDLTFARVTDSGAGSSLLVMGGDYGLRLRPAGDRSDWAIDAPGQWGEPYLLLDPGADMEPI